MMQETDDDLPIGASFSKGKLYFVNGENLYEFDGRNFKKKEHMRTTAFLILGPVLLSFGCSIIFEVVSKLIEAKHSPFVLVPILCFFVFFGVGVVRPMMKGTLQQLQGANSSLFGGQRLDLSDPETRARLSRIYQKQLLQSRSSQQPNAFIRYLLAAIFYPIMVGMLFVGPVITGGHLVDAIKGPNTGNTKNEVADESDAEKEKRLTSLLAQQVKANQQSEALETREALADVYGNQKKYKPAVAAYRISLDQRYIRLAAATTEQDSQKQLSEICNDSSWLSYLLNAIGDKTGSEQVAAQVLDKIAQDSNAKKLDQYLEKRSFIRRVAKYLEDGGYEDVGKETNYALKRVDGLAPAERDSALQEVLKHLYAAMYDTTDPDK